MLTLVAAIPAVAKVSDGIEGARTIARNFVRGGSRFGQTLGSGIERIERHAVTNAAAFYSVKLSERGTLFVSESDCRVVAFTASTNDFDALPADSPLKALLERDAIVRANIAALSSSTVNTNSPYYSNSTNQLSVVDEIRVAPLLKTKWSQSSAQGHYCYNYYTPSHYVCGCSATALSQVMRYFEFPNSAIAPQTFACTVGSKSRQLTTQGGLYDYALMPNEPASAAYSDAAWSAIGKLTSDVGIALSSSYTSSGTGASPEDMPYAITNYFGYSNVFAYGFNMTQLNSAYYGDGLVHDTTALYLRENRQNMIGANLDAGLPVLLGIYGYSVGYVGTTSKWAGHAIVGDGYGYCRVGDESVPYVHLNLGWAGSDDAWYNIPEICTAETGAVAGDSGYDFTVMWACIGNIYTNQTGEIVSGRVMDSVGNPVAGAKVSATGGYEDTSDSQGIYALIVPSNRRYTLEAISRDESTTGSVDVVVMRSTGNDIIGNQWGRDIQLGIVQTQLEVIVSIEYPAGVYLEADEFSHQPGTYLYSPGSKVVVSAPESLAVTNGYGTPMSLHLLENATNSVSLTLESSTNIVWRYHQAADYYSFSIVTIGEHGSKYDDDYLFVNYDEGYIANFEINEECWLKSGTEFDFMVPSDLNHGDSFYSDVLYYIYLGYLYCYDYSETLRLGKVTMGLTDGYRTPQLDAVGHLASSFRVCVTQATEIVAYYYNDTLMFENTNLPKWWYMRNLWGADDDSGAYSTEQGDPDGDGYGNYFEYRRDTDPLDAASHPQPSAIFLK